MRLCTFLLCEDVRREVKNTRTIVGQFSTIRGGLNDNISFRCFYGITGYRGMAKLKVVVRTLTGQVFKEFLTDDIPCIDPLEQYVGVVDVKNLRLRFYGRYNISLFHSGIELGSTNFNFLLPNPNDNKIVLNGRELEVPRLFMRDNTELEQYARCFVRRFHLLKKEFSTVKFISQFNDADGVGSVSILLVDEMIRNGIGVNPVPIFPDNPSKKYIDGIEESKKVKEPTDITIVNALPPHIKDGKDDKRVLLFTYWESDMINNGWRNVANTADAVFVPSNYVRNVYINNGVRKHVFKYDQPVSDVFTYRKKQDNDYFTILFIGTCIPRKGLDIFCKACNFVFDDDPDVRMRIHVKPWSKRLGDSRAWLLDTYGDNKKFFITSECLEVSEIWGLMCEADILVAPSRSEGLGLIPIQSIISGTPVIIPRHSGFLEYIDTPGIVSIDDIDEVSSEGIYQGSWYEPSFDNLVDILRGIKYRRDELLGEARSGSKILKDRYNSIKTYSNLASEINKFYRKG